MAVPLMPNPLICSSETPEIYSILALGHMNNLLLNLSNKTQATLTCIRLYCVASKRGKKQNAVNILTFCLRFPRHFLSIWSSHFFFIIWTFVGQEVAARQPPIDSEALLNSREIRRPGFPSKSSLFAQYGECD